MRRVVLVARPTPSGVDGRSSTTLARAVAEQLGAPARVAYLDQADPSVAAVLDEVAAVADPADDVVLVPLALPADPYLRNWIARAAAHWLESRDSGLLVQLSPPPVSAFQATTAPGGPSGGGGAAGGHARFRGADRVGPIVGVRVPGRRASIWLLGETAPSCRRAARLPHHPSYRGGRARSTPPTWHKFYAG